MYRYSKKYHHLPFTDEFVAMKETRNRCDILKSTANLTRYLDIKNDTSFHEEFTKWVKKKEIKWSVRNNRNNYVIANQISLKGVLGRIRKLPRKYRIFGLFVLVSGLRTEESMTAFNNHSKICHDGIMEMFWDRETKRANAVYCHPQLHNSISYTVNETGVRRNLKSSILGCEIRYLRKLNYTINATKLDPLLAEFMQGRRGNISQRHYFLPLMNNNRKKWIKTWNQIIKNEEI